MLQECISGCSGFKNTPECVARTDFEAVWPVIGCEVTCNAVATDCSNVELFTNGPTGFSPRGSSNEPYSPPFMSHAFNPWWEKKYFELILVANQRCTTALASLTSNRFSQNSCFGFSCCAPCFSSDFTLLSWFRCRVTGCLKIEAVWRMGGTRETSVRTPRLKMWEWKEKQLLLIWTSSSAKCNNTMEEKRMFYEMLKL